MLHFKFFLCTYTEEDKKVGQTPSNVVVLCTYFYKFYSWFQPTAVKQHFSLKIPETQAPISFFTRNFTCCFLGQDQARPLETNLIVLETVNKK